MLTVLRLSRRCIKRVPQFGQKIPATGGDEGSAREPVRVGPFIATDAAGTQGKTITCEGHETDQYGRLIARCSTDGFPDTGARLVASGLAWAFVNYSTDYSALEEGPRAKRIGIWQSKTQPPWEYRARRCDTATKLASDGCPIKGNINDKGEKICKKVRYFLAQTAFSTKRVNHWGPRATVYDGISIPDQKLSVAVNTQYFGTTIVLIQ
jgi:hypothetical protein